MAENETVVIQIRDENTGHWLDYSRCTPEQAEYHLMAQAPGKFRGVDWISREVVLPPLAGRTFRESAYSDDADALARGMEIVNECPRCGGYTYTASTLRQIARGQISADENPTHSCESPGYVHTVKREPDAVEVHRLGHYEQMQMSLALRLALQALAAPARGLDGYDLADAQVIRELRSLFSTEGTVTLVKDLDA